MTISSLGSLDSY
ncbi:5821296b-4a39-497a-ba3d-126611679843 [Thermothielavioides terrestris]|uniref:5821296b-4a39-497a-ba3d-126611679843 n=1 Tax=Thermothielavioides terrestris TaxID=2587410 RepID=A0A446BMT9_9PEZI|nr:5821296b-4a39-497a-ba3d-126611679843 [Thermothielavioides terrestris]